MVATIKNGKFWDNAQFFNISKPYLDQGLVGGDLPPNHLFLNSLIDEKAFDPVIVLAYIARTFSEKSYSIKIFKPGQNIMSVLKRNIQIPPPLSTD